MRKRAAGGYSTRPIALILAVLGVSLASLAAAQGSNQLAGALKSYTETIPGSVVKIDMVTVPAGSVMIAPADPKGKPQTVQLKPFYIAKTETTWEAFDAFTSSGPPSQAYDQTKFTPDAIARPSKSYIPPDLGWGHHGYPVINESYLNATMFCRWLSSKTGKKYRLPTEAEWEYAARAGKNGPWQMPAAELGKYAWYDANSKGQTQPVGKKVPNAWGLYDTLGNVGEWADSLVGKPVICGGWWDLKAPAINPSARAYQTSAWQATDPQLPKSRWWLSDANFAGFRIVCDP